MHHPPGMLMAVARLDEVVKNLTLSDHLFGSPCLLFREETFKKFPKGPTAGREGIGFLKPADNSKKEMKDLDDQIG